MSLPEEPVQAKAASFPGKVYRQSLWLDSPLAA